MAQKPVEQMSKKELLLLLEKNDSESALLRKDIAELKNEKTQILALNKLLEGSVLNL